MDKKYYLLVLMFAWILSGKTLYSQVLDVGDRPPASWPVGDYDDLSSAFGPRNQGQVEWVENGWDDTDLDTQYNYDFHRGVDIGATGMISAIMGGTVHAVVQEGSNYYIIIKSEFDYNGQILTWFWKYNHVWAAVLEGETITTGEQNIAAVQVDHLDVKFYPFGVYALYADAWHPMWALPYEDFYDPSITNMIYSADFSGHFIGFDVNADDEELDVVDITIELEAWREDGGKYNTNELLRSTGENNYYVSYDYKYNCGDIELNEDSDAGYNNYIRILPYIFDRSDNEHTVQYRFYIKPEVVDNIYNDEIYAEVSVMDCNWNVETQGYYLESTCIECGGPGLPYPPENITATPNNSKMTIELHWNPPSSGPDPDYYVIYRRSSDSSEPQNARVIGITSNTSFSDDKRTTPGQSYYYALASVIYHDPPGGDGEGENSTELLCTMPSSGTVTTSRLWKGDAHIYGNVTVNNNATLTIERGSNVKFHGYYSFTVNAGSRIIAEGTEGQPITFTTASGTLTDKYKYLQLLGGNNSIKWCNFEYGWYPLYLYNCTASEGTTNVIENCTFRNNSHYGLRIVGSVAKVKGCQMYNNGFYGLHCQSNPDVKFTGNHIYNNVSNGIYTLTGNFLEYYGNVIENNGGYGMYTASADHVHIGRPYGFYGYNTIRENGNTEVYAYSGKPNVELNYSSIHDDSGYEVSNYAGNTPIYAQNCFWEGGTPTCYKYTGTITFDNPQCSTPQWDGDIYTDGPLGKAIADEVNNLTLAPPMSEREKIKQCKDVLAKNSKSSEATEALSLLYSIIRADYVKNELGEKEQFVEYLQNVKRNYKNNETSKLAIQYMIIWKMLEIDYSSVVRLSNDALKIMTGEDRKWVLVDLAFAYTHSGQLKEAKNVLQELESDGADEYLLAMIHDDIMDIEWQMSEGLWNSEEGGKDAPIGSLVDKSVGLSQNFPNPGNPMTTILFKLPDARHVTLTVFNLVGQKVKVILDEERQAGLHSVIWDGKNDQGFNVASGIYLYTLNIGDRIFTKKLILVR
jgi:hypothetical protein